MLTIIRVFGLKVIEIERLSAEEAKEIKIVEASKPQGLVLDIKPEDLQKDGDTN